ncbi:PLDc N-terminal domain-containing protein [Riemerella anatipestifer]|uniref:PLDc N-terminal domain-containing protein n=1 Tax=Riemerella anatipestifer TaxID=34085 RepID=UPI000B31B52B|nr:hypothetical protein [Riemerella anatipestifer]MSN87093.1 hypothetical protein [Riemerella anatipestifer]NAV17081.1 hypothetical protein [Riemerella anatipestifer]
MNVLILTLVFTLIIANFIWAVVNIGKNEPNRLLWHLFVCFFSVFGPLVFLAKSRK